jgi:hypothetical protein
MVSVLVQKMGWELDLEPDVLELALVQVLVLVQKTLASRIHDDLFGNR